MSSLLAAELWKWGSFESFFCLTQGQQQLIFALTGITSLQLQGISHCHVPAEIMVKTYKIQDASLPEEYRFRGQEQISSLENTRGRSNWLTMTLKFSILLPVFLAFVGVGWTSAPTYCMSRQFVFSFMSNIF